MSLEEAPLVLAAPQMVARMLAAECPPNLYLSNPESELKWIVALVWAAAAPQVAVA